MTEWFESLRLWLSETGQSAAAAFTSPFLYSQLAIAIVALASAAILSRLIKHGVHAFQAPPADSAKSPLRRMLYNSRTVVLPILALVTLGIAVGIADRQLDESWLIRVARGLIAIGFFFVLIARLVQNRLIKFLLAWVGIPLAVLQSLGWLRPLAELLDSQAWTIGSLELSLLDLARTAVFGTLLFWFGALLNTVGKNLIRERESWNPNTRELAIKLFEIGIFFLIFLLLLNLMRIDLTALAVFGGALGIGLGFGLQQIASNFISGIIILIDRSITPGDFVELEDGRSGWLRELNMRYGILETYDGKDIMVPNESFITSSYTNWTHKDKRQRYSIRFQVAYSTDLDLLFDLIRKICVAHPKVISDPELPAEFLPDAEIEAFGESGIDILVEFWMAGIDDGENRVGADLRQAIWKMIQEHGMQIPFPQREVRIVGERTDTRART